MLGVAFYYAENVDKAIEYLDQALRIDPDYADSLFNLGKLEYARNHKRDAKRYWQAYLRQDANSNWARLLRTKYGVGEPPSRSRGLLTKNNEMLAGLQVGNYNEEVPSAWGTPMSKEFPLQNTSHAASYYENGVTTVSEGDEIRTLLANQHYQGKSQRGVKIGDYRSNVFTAYGPPTMSLLTTQGNSLVYLEQGITFLVREDKVVSWIIY